MKTAFIRNIAAITLVAAVLLTGNAQAAGKVTAQLDRHDIALGEAAQLTVTVTGNGRETVTPPTVPGLQFNAVGQSSQYRSINGVASSIVTVTFQVIPQRVGTFNIPAPTQGGQSLTLNVRPGNGRSGTLNNNGQLPAPNLPPPNSGGLTAGETRVSRDGSAFVRLLMPRRELFVGETVPVEIQVGLRPGLVASLNGLPTLNGDQFTLNKLSSEPEQSQEIIGGQPFTVLTWHSALAAVKPGEFAITVETPLTVRMRTAPQRRARSLFDDPFFGNPFDDPFFQNFFGGTTEKQITVASEPDALKIEALPTENRPVGFNGAVGDFEVSSELSTAKASVGEPITLSMKVTGSGSFDRVQSPMLDGVDGWKTYKPSASFSPADIAGYSGEKVFEQAIIPMKSGKQTVPEIAFSYFNPETKQFETKHTAPLEIDILDAPAGSLAKSAPAATAANANAETETESVIPGLRPDHVETRRGVSTLRPLYFRPWFVATQSALALSFIGAFAFIRIKDKRGDNAGRDHQRSADSVISSCVAEMNAAVAASDANRFFQSARAALQQNLASRWHVEPGSITVADIDERLNGAGAELRRVFAMADQSAYSGQRLSATDLEQWKETVIQQLKERDAR